jgi:cytochrome c peroxidase
VRWVFRSACIVALGCGAESPAPVEPGTTGDDASSTSTSTDASSSSEPPDAGASSSSTSGGEGDPDPTDEQWARLLALRYDDGPPPPDITNAWADDEAAAELGRALFFDPRFSGPLLDGDNDGSPGTLGSDGDVNRVACASCHVPVDGFVDTRSPHRQISLAAGWVLRKTPSLLEVGFAKLLAWGGRRDALHNVTFGAIESSREFNSSRLYFAKQLHAHHRDRYEAVFGAMPDFADETRFGALAAEHAGCPEIDAPAAMCNGRPGDQGIYDGLAPADQDEVTRTVVLASKAIGAYLRQLRCGRSRFDDWLDGDDTALSAAEQRGAILFVSEGECDRCHGGPMLSDYAFHNVGLVPQPVAVVFVDLDDYGASEGLEAALDDPLNSRGVWSDGDDDRLPDEVDGSMVGAFRTPSLRCIASHPSFMHTGHMSSLAEVVAFFRRGGDPGGYPGQSELHPLDLDARDEADLVAFLEALTGAGPDAALLEPPP